MTDNQQTHRDITYQDKEMMRFRWRNRRRMTWLILMGLFVFTWYLSVYVDSDRLNAMSALIGWVFGVGMGVIGAYFGFATFDHVKHIKKDE